MEKLPAGGKLFFVYLLACLVCLFFLPCLLASIFTDTYSPQKQVQKPGAKEEKGVSLKNILTQLKNISNCEFCKYLKLKFKESVFVKFLKKKHELFKS